jgi:phosphoribosylaminoimidazole-succinocarboxamide synthase
MHVEPFASVSLDLPDHRSGKVRESFRLDADHRLFITTDRLSAFDRIVAAVPYKGQVLNELSAWWFTATRDIVDNHMVSIPDPNALVALETTPLPVEVVVRGALTGSTSTSIGKMYERGERSFYGYNFVDGIAPHALLPQPIITPTTKALSGGHDEPLACTDVVDRALVDGALWERVCAIALALFERGQHLAHRAGLILADTKYEFGIDTNGRLLLIDEIHTPDSSRIWVEKTYAERTSGGREPESLDKEPLRLALAEAGYRGDGPPPKLDEAVLSATSHRYINAYERLTSTAFVPGTYPVAPRLTTALHREGLL